MSLNPNIPIIDGRKLRHLLNAGKIITTGGNSVVYKVRTCDIPSLELRNRMKYFRSKHSPPEEEKEEIEEEEEEFVAVKLVETLDLGVFREYKKTLISSLNMIEEVKDMRYCVKMYAFLDDPLFKENESLFQFGSFFGIIMEHCPESMDRIIVKGGLSVSEKTKYLYQLSIALRSLHSQGIIHRDLKWNNVLLSNEGSLRLADFDMCSKGYTSTVVGTPYFIAPELISVNTSSAKIDVYSFGIMIYSLLFETNEPYASLFGIKTRRNKKYSEEIDDETEEKSYICPRCKNKLWPFTTFRLMICISRCHLRPDLKHIYKTPTRNISKENFPEYLIDLMVSCWSPLPDDRPSFDRIVKIFGRMEKMDQALMDWRERVEYMMKGDYLMKGENYSGRWLTVTIKEQNLGSFPRFLAMV